MSKYSLCFIENNSINILDLSSYDLPELNDIKTIDLFTTMFNNEEDLLDDLKIKKIIDNNVTKLYIFCEENNKSGIIYNGDILLFKKNKDHLNTSYAGWVFECYKKDPEKMLILASLYAKKYSEKPTMLNKVNNLYEYANSRINGFYDAASYTEQNEMDEYVDNFIKSEFHIRTKSGFSVKYMSIHDFIVKKMYVDGNLDIDRKHSYLSINYKNYPVNHKTNEEEITEEYEEFITREDMERVNKEILKDYKCDKFEPIEEGNDIVTPLTKKDLKTSLEDIGRKLVLKPGDGDLN